MGRNGGSHAAGFDWIVALRIPTDGESGTSEATEQGGRDVQRERRLGRRVRA